VCGEQHVPGKPRVILYICEALYGWLCNLSSAAASNVLKALSEAIFEWETNRSGMKL